MPASQEVRKENVFRKGGITGVAVVCEMLTGGLFMENVKMEKQRTSQPYPTIMRRTLAQGIKGFEAGFWPWGFTLGMTKGVVLGSARAFFLNTFLNTGMSKKRADLISGFAAGAVQGVFMSPILLARTRVNQSLTERATQAAASGVASGVAASHKQLDTTLFGEMMLSMKILNESIHKEGLSTLLIGMPTMIFKRAMDWGMRFLIISRIKQKYRDINNKDKLNNIEDLTCTFTGGSLAVFITMPIDRLMPILQAAGANKDESIQYIIKQQLGKEGLATLQRGLVMRVIHCGWHTTWAIFISKKIYEYIDKRI